MAVRLITLHIGYPLSTVRFLVLNSVRGSVHLRVVVLLEGIDNSMALVRE
jgi:hypothetical protein